MASAPAAIGMTVPLLRSDLEQAVEEIAAFGFRGVEVFRDHLGPGMADVNITSAHARAARGLLHRHGLVPTVLNCITGQFAPLRGGDELRRAVERLAGDLTLAAALGARRVLIWDCETEEPAEVRNAPGRLAECIERAYKLSDVSDRVEVSVELHPNTVGWRHNCSGEIAAELMAVGAGVCLDFCHAGVALGPHFMQVMDRRVVAAVNLVHWSDSDCETEQLHFPPGQGIVGLQEAEFALAGRDLQVSWDLFSWPSPRSAIEAGMPRYHEALNRIGAAALP